MQYEANQFFNKFNLIIGIAAHFLLQILDGIMVEVGHIEVNIEFIEEVVMLIRILDDILDGLFGGDMLKMDIFGHENVND